MAPAWSGAICMLALLTLVGFVSLECRELAFGCSFVMAEYQD
jgi:hypothetical protein